ncbi:MAG: hypothetical protein K9M07_07020 [Simkaniaceae bacterium]|nr:hypothetical protein [Simkaniaceae bacterium]
MDISELPPYTYFQRLNTLSQELKAPYIVISAVGISALSILALYYTHQMFHSIYEISKFRNTQWRSFLKAEIVKLETGVDQAKKISLESKSSYEKTQGEFNILKSQIEEIVEQHLKATKEAEERDRWVIDAPNALNTMAQIYLDTQAASTRISETYVLASNELKEKLTEAQHLTRSYTAIQIRLKENHDRLSALSRKYEGQLVAMERLKASTEDKCTEVQKISGKAAQSVRHTQLTSSAARASKGRDAHAVSSARTAGHKSRRALNRAEKAQAEAKETLHATLSEYEKLTLLAGEIEELKSCNSELESQSINAKEKLEQANKTCQAAQEKCSDLKSLADEAREKAITTYTQYELVHTRAIHAKSNADKAHLYVREIKQKQSELVKTANKAKEECEQLKELASTAESAFQRLLHRHRQHILLC